MPVRKVHSTEDIQKIKDEVLIASQETRRKLGELSTAHMEALYSLKFEAYGYSPFSKDQGLNLIEQLNQTFTTTATLVAAEKLLRKFPELKNKGLKLNLGPTRGWDIESVDSDEIKAEVFTAVNFNNNRKLKGDVKRLQEKAKGTKALFVFFHCPGEKPGQRHDLEEKYSTGQEGTRVQIWSLDKSEIMAECRVLLSQESETEARP